MELAWYRSWPAPEEWAAHDLDQRPHVVDRLPRLLMSGQDYQRVEWPDHRPGFCMLEWDVALDPVARRAFAAEALVEPAEVLVASYRFHDTSIDWIGNHGEGPTTDGRPIRPGCPTCGESRTDSFGLGCIYLPAHILDSFLSQMDHTGFNDYTFGSYVRRHYGQARVSWRVHPQHLHDYEEAP